MKEITKLRQKKQSGKDRMRITSTIAVLASAVFTANFYYGGLLWPVGTEVAFSADRCDFNGGK
ncbi:MAG: hypothetical protein PHR28_13515 [candidate division Zixibacteria bacterium]|nr:hypothetical protein [candidate division Zixibacteria bacterium]